MSLDHDLERSLLGGCLVHRIRPVLTEDDYSDPRHRVIHNVLCRMCDGDVPIELPLVVDCLEKDGVLKAAGGAAYLATLWDVAASPESIDRYADMLRDRSISRRIKELCLSVASGDKRPDPVEFRASVDRIFDRVIDTPEESRIQNVAGKLLAKIDRSRRLFHRGIPTPFHKLTQWTGGFHGGDLIVVAARPGVGKTSLLIQFSLWAANNGADVMFLSLEMGSDQIVSRILSVISGIDLLRLRLGPLTDHEIVQLNERAATLNNLAFNIYVNGISTTSEIASLIRRHKPTFICIDYLQMIRDDEQSERRDLEIAKITRALKRLAVEMQIPIVLASQLNRGIEHRASYEPFLSDLRDSGSIEQDADMVLFIANQKDVKTHKNLIIAKHRNGPTGKLQLMWNEKSTMFLDIED